jgi:hypothetical protein
VTDPRTPEILAWLETLPLAERLATMHAMVLAFPALHRSQQWKARLAVVRAELAPTAKQLGDILKKASQISMRLKAGLAG